MPTGPIQEIAKQAAGAGIPFLVIGGYAVFAHGYVRSNEDLDLISPRSGRAQWARLLGNLGMSIKNDDANFAQLHPSDENGMEVDLMFVSDEVFVRLDLNEPELRATILKHGNMELYEELRHLCAEE